MKKLGTIILLAVFAVNVNAQQTKAIEEKLSTGLIAKYNVLQSDETVKHGDYAIYLEDRLTVAGKFFKDQLNGRWTFFYEDGSPALISYYDKGLKTGTWDYFDTQGGLCYKVTYFEDKKDGEAVGYYPNGKQRMISRYRTDTLILLRQVSKQSIIVEEAEMFLHKDSTKIVLRRYPTGMPYNKIMYEKNNPYYVLEYFDGANQEMDFGSLKNGNGVFKHFMINVDGNSQLVAEITYKDGIKEGPVTFYRNEIPIARGNYSSNALEGELTFYDEKDRKTGSAHFFKGRSKLPIDQNIAEIINSVERDDYNVSQDLESIEPEFPGGNTALASYLLHQFELPKDIDSKKDIPKTKIMAYLSIDQTGKASVVGFDDKTDERFKAPFITLVENMPLWKPGLRRGIPQVYDVIVPMQLELR